MANLVPVPEDLPTSTAVEALTGSSLSASGSGPRTSPVARYLGAIRRVKWLVLLLTLAGFGGGIIVSRLRPESYEVNGVLQLSPDESSPFIAQQYSQYILQYHIIEPIVVARRLYIIGPKRTGAPPPPPGPSGINKALFSGFSLDSAHAPTAGDYRLKIASDRKTWELTNTGTGARERGAVGDSIGRTFYFRWSPPIEGRWAGETFDFTVLTSREAADQIRKSLKDDLLPAGAPRFMYLSLSGQDGEATAGVLNDLMVRFVEQTSMNKRLKLSTEAHAYDSMLNYAQGRLQDDERKLQGYKVKTITLPRDQLPVAPGLAATQPMAYEAYLSQRNSLNNLRKDRRDLANALLKL